MDHPERLATAIRDQAAAQGFTYETFAVAASIPKSTLQRWLTGQPQLITIDGLDRIAAALGTTMPALVAASSGAPQAAA